MKSITDLVLKATPDKEQSGADSTAPMYGVCKAILANPEAGSKEALQAILKRFRDAPFSRPYVGQRTLTLLDLCIQNCGRPFHLELHSSHFVDEMRRLVRLAHKAVVEQFLCLLVKWAEQDYQVNKQLKPLHDLYEQLKADGVKFRPSAISNNKNSGGGAAVAAATNTKQNGDDRDAELREREENDFRNAIAASLETAKSANVGRASSPKNKALTEPKKVRALYDFEAIEDNELTFKAGEILLVEEFSNEYWWSGSNHRGRGLFPANFVTSDLNVSVSNAQQTQVAECDNVLNGGEVRVREQQQQQQPTIDENRIDDTLRMLHNADVTTEEGKLSEMERNCQQMAPLIQQELETVDKRQAQLSALAKQLSESMSLYHTMINADPAPGYYPYHPPTYPYPPTAVGGYLPNQYPTYSYPVASSVVPQPPVMYSNTAMGYAPHSYGYPTPQSHPTPQGYPAPQGYSYPVVSTAVVDNNDNNGVVSSQNNQSQANAPQVALSNTTM